MKAIKSLGIDASTSATGVVLLTTTGGQTPCRLLEIELKSKQPAGAARNRELVTAMMELIHTHKPDKIVIEGYSLNLKNASSIVPLVELGGLLRFCLHLDGLSWYDPTAPEVKKFVTGKGNAPKDIVMMNVLKRWGHESKTNNTADAYACAAMGLAVVNQLPGITVDMRLIAGKMKLKTS